MTLVELLNAYVGEGETIGKPWSDGHYSYATNGYVLVRVPRQYEIPERPASELPNWKVYIEKYPIPQDGWKPLPGLESLGIKECERCKGNPKPSKPCPECFGDGELVFESDFNTYDVTCRMCGGSGEVGGCQVCDGTGFDAPYRVEIDGWAYSPNFILDFLRTFQDIEIGSPQQKGLATWFRSGEAVLSIMPLTLAEFIQA